MHLPTRQDGVKNRDKSYTLSKNHIKNAMLTRAKMTPYFIRTENLKRAAHSYLAHKWEYPREGVDHTQVTQAHCTHKTSM